MLTVNPGDWTATPQPQELWAMGGRTWYFQARGSGDPAKSITTEVEETEEGVDGGR